MRPGTYVPTDPREIEAFALHRVKETFDDFSRSIHEIENVYREIGMRYHLVELPNRSAMDVGDVKAVCNDAFNVPPNNTKMPAIITSISKLRVARNTIKQHIRRGEGINAEHQMKDARSSIDDLHDELRLLRHCVELHLDDRNYPTSLHDHEPTPLMLQRMEELSRNWILALPEVKSRVEHGFYTAGEALLGMDWELAYDKQEDGLADLRVSFSVTDTPAPRPFLTGVGRLLWDVEFARDSDHQLLAPSVFTDR